jgi:tetratricopeptide (TPR) repeat protein
MFSLISSQWLRRASVVAVSAGLAVSLSACSSGGSSSSSTTSASSARSLLLQGVAAQRAGNLSQAESYYQQAIAADPSDQGHQAAVAYYDLGVIAQQNRSRGQAIDYYNKTLALYPQFQPALYNLAIELTASDPTKALELYNKVVAANPRNANALFNSGLLAYRLGNQTLGVQRIKQALAINPKLSVRIPPSINMNA